MGNPKQSEVLRSLLHALPCAAVVAALPLEGPRRPGPTPAHICTRTGLTAVHRPSQFELSVCAVRASVNDRASFEQQAGALARRASHTIPRLCPSVPLFAHNRRSRTSIAHTHTRTQTNTHTCARTYTHTPTHTHKHTRTHTHARKPHGHIHTDTDTRVDACRVNMPAFDGAGA